MNRDQRKLSRSLEERGTLASITRSSQLSQKDNELKQKLDAIDTSYKLSNKRIKKETRELREILYGFQRELKLSKPMKEVYTPSLLEKPHHGRVRRTTVSSVPSEDRKEVWLERCQDGREKAKYLEFSDMERRKSESFQSGSPAHDVQTIEEGISREKPCDKIRSAQEDELKELKDNRSPVFAQEIIRDLRAQQPKSSELKNELNFLPEGSQTKTWESESGVSRSVVQAGNRRVLGHSLTEHQDRRKKSSVDGSHSFSKSFRGRFITDETISTGSTRKKSQPQQISEIGMNRHRPSIGEELPSVPKQRKVSLNVPLYPRQRKDSNGRDGSPMGGPPMRLSSNDSSVSAFDSLPENLGGRRMSVAHGRVRKISRATGLPPLKEETNRQQESLVENWGDLAKCRYLRKEENDISIDDIFRKE